MTWHACTQSHTQSKSKNCIVPFWRNVRKKCYFLPILFSPLILCPLRRAYTAKEITKACVRKEWEKALAPHSSTLAWRIPWTEEPGGLQSTELQTDTTEASQHARISTYYSFFSEYISRLSMKILFKGTYLYKTRSEEISQKPQNHTSTWKTILLLPML